MEEIKNAIRSLPNDKAWGPDGFEIEFYKMHSDVIVPLLFQMINFSEKKKVICPYLCPLEKGQRWNKSYHSLSLLNSNQKIIVKVRLTGKINTLALGGISLDARQAFDQVEGRYMFAALEKFGFGLNVRTILKMLNGGPQSSVLMYHERSSRSRCIAAPGKTVASCQCFLR